MIFGSAFHDFIMLPEEFKKNFAVEPVKEEGMLETVEQIKAVLLKHVTDAATPLRQELEGLEHSLKVNDESCSIPCPAEEELNALKPDDYPTKKDLAVKQKELKEEIKEYQAKCKAKSNEIKAQIKTVKDSIQTIESKLTGTKPKLIAALRDFNKEVKIWDEIYTQFETTAAGKSILSADDMAKIKIMADRTRNHPDIQALWKEGNKIIYEQSFFWRDPQSGLLCKCRPDVLIITANMVLPFDWKTTECAERNAFSKTVVKNEYHIQDDFYLDGINTVLNLSLNAFVFAAIEKEEPHELALYVLSDVDRDLGRTTYKRLLMILATLEANLTSSLPVWKGYPRGIQDLALPAYAHYMEA
jgi:hypothetical protein